MDPHFSEDVQKLRDAAAKMTYEEAEAAGRIDVLNYKRAALVRKVIATGEGDAVAAMLSMAPAAVLNSSGDRVGGTALHAAAAKLDVRAVETILARGVDPNIRDGYSNPALYRAIEAGRTVATSDRAVEVVRVLLARGADPNAASSYGETPLIAVAELMEDHDPNAVRMLNLLTNNGAEVDARHELGTTALFEAIFRNKPAISLRLYALGADLNTTDKFGRDVMYFAAQNGAAAWVTALIAQERAREAAVLRGMAGRPPEDEEKKAPARDLPPELIERIIALQRGQPWPQALRDAMWEATRLKAGFVDLV